MHKLNPVTLITCYAYTAFCSCFISRALIRPTQAVHSHSRRICDMSCDIASTKLQDDAIILLCLPAGGTGAMLLTVVVQGVTSLT